MTTQDRRHPVHEIRATWPNEARDFTPWPVGHLDLRDFHRVFHDRVKMLP